MLAHGGRLKRAAKQFGIEESQWIDLSTGINPQGWQVPSLPTACWQRLPEQEDGLETAAATYYGCDSLLPVAGSQAAIQSLPYLRPHCRVGFPLIGYEEHRYNWQQAGHQLTPLATDQISQLIDRLDVLVLINPNNPTGERFSTQQLLKWHATLARRGGWLIVDEAFIDPQPENSLLDHCPQPGLIVLRSVGKFFGLAGIRAGFVFADQSLLKPLAEKLGPWPLSGPTREACRQAFLDESWQQKTRQHLSQQSQRLQRLLGQYFDARNLRGTELFQTLSSPHATVLFQHFATRGILLRLFETEQLVRFGLPNHPGDWQRLDLALAELPATLQSTTTDTSVNGAITTL
ncbi:threonine-phosphate decarboxylase [Motiliproteus coralliicola]|uniref:threonine-phosphate decarboxylase n=1 Tax=Motiliproteus coralliicola TaxID=2283196 RepID=A0A369WRK2_9GAMM|nr:threonine-phosphate decarboxylase CobD [Motiliproteus coralliicola]RDE24748.1 threonine-phosphate decarboxylase [Motiliproteus coralliicola]